MNQENSNDDISVSLYSLRILSCLLYDAGFPTGFGAGFPSGFGAGFGPGFFSRISAVDEEVS